MRTTLGLVLLLMAACDAVRPEDTSTIVVEAYLVAGLPVSSVHVRRTLPLSVPYPVDATTAVAGADVTITVANTPIAFQQTDSGYYAPRQRLETPDNAAIALRVNWAGERITATSRVPPRIRIDSVNVQRTEKPVRGLILDALLIDPVILDSLGVDSLRIGAQETNLYLVEATVHWTVDFIGLQPDSAWWIRTHLAPALETGGLAEDYFLRTEQVQLERDTDARSARHRYWSGVYAVPVESADAPIPAHALRISLLRSPYEYAQFVTGRSSPADREPPSNVIGARGIFTGLAVDSVVVLVE